MAGSRLPRFGTIFTRMTGLLRSGAVKEDSKPIWYDVYKAFPPKLEPNMFRPVPNVEIINILYPEDYIRARFYDRFGSPGLIDMTNQISNYKSLSQRFIDKYIEIAKNSDNRLSDEQLFKSTEEALISEGFKLKFEETKVYSDAKPVKSNVGEEKLKSNLSSSTMASIALDD